MNKSAHGGRAPANGRAMGDQELAISRRLHERLGRKKERDPVPSAPGRYQGALVLSKSERRTPASFTVCDCPLVESFPHLLV